MLQILTQNLLAAINSEISSVEEINYRISEFLKLFTESTQSDQNEALEKLVSSLIAKESVKYNGALANIIGHLFERGYVPAAAPNRLIAYFERLLASSATISQRLAEKMANITDALNNDEDEPDEYEFFEEQFPLLAEQFPDEARDWQIFDEIWCCGIALFSVSREARHAARGLRPLALQNGEFHVGAHWFNVMFSVFDDEPFIAIERDRMVGVIGKMSGVVDNFQLHILLTDVFPSGWFNTANPREVIQNAKGFGEQCLGIGAKGVWNMYDWTAVQSDLNLPNGHGNTGCWIWGEGKPEDIPVFEGYRVIILGEPLYQRGWNAQRMFSNLPAELKVEQKLSRHEVLGWLKKMADTPK